MYYLDNYQTLDTRSSGRRKQDQFFMNLVDIMNIGVAVTDCDRKIIYLNENFRAITGHSDNSMTGRDLIDSFDFINSQIVKEIYQDCLKKNRSSLELSWKRQDGKQMNARISLKSFENAGHKNKLIFVVITDITEFKNAQKAILHSENTYKAVVDNSLAGLFIEQEGKIIYANRRFAGMLGFEINHLIGVETRLFFQGAYNDTTEEIQTHRKDGNPVWIKLNSRKIVYNGSPAVLCHVIEISREKIMENRLLELERRMATFSDRLRADQQNQRKKIAMDLHNGIGKSLLVTKSLIEKLMEAHPGNLNAITDLSNIAELLQNATEEARRIAMTLHPAMLDDIGLKATINWHCQQYQSIFPSIKISSIIDFDEKQLPESLKTAAYSIIQEVLHEIAGYFGTTQIKIHLFSSTGMLNLVIKDNGVSLSLDNDEASGSGRFALNQSSLKERIRRTGGKFAVGRNHENHGKYRYFSWPIDQ